MRCGEGRAARYRDLENFSGTKWQLSSLLPAAIFIAAGSLLHSCRQLSSSLLGLNASIKGNNEGKQQEQNVGLTRDDKDDQKLRGIKNNKKHDQDCQEKECKEQIHNCLDKKDKNYQHEKNKFTTVKLRKKQNVEWSGVEWIPLRLLRLLEHLRC